MSERPTPETDSQIKTFTSVSKLKKSFENRTGTVSAGFARRLERERDEALAAIVGWENKWKCAVEMAAQAEVERDEARERLHKVLKVLDDYEQSIKNPSSPFWDAFKKWFTSEGAK